MRVELIHAPGCAKCMTDQDVLRDAAEAACASVEWREVNVLEQLDYAVELGVLSLPSIAINGQLAFAFLPSPSKLAEAIKRRARQA